MTLARELVMRFEEAVREETQALKNMFDKQTAVSEGKLQEAQRRTTRLREALIEAIQS